VSRATAQPPTLAHIKSLPLALQEGVAEAKIKLTRLAETREFLQGLSEYASSEDVLVLEGIITDSRKLEIENHESVRIVAAQLDRAKRIVIVQQAMASAVSRSHLSDLDTSISAALQLVGAERDFVVEAKKCRLCVLCFEFVMM
jgi:hypothetical protein